MVKIQTSTDVFFLYPASRGNPHTQYQYLCKEKNEAVVIGIFAAFQTR
jgi:hypothetical protein